MNTTLRRETTADMAAIHALTKAAFRDDPHGTHTEQFIVDALRRDGALSISLVAEQEATIIGHVAVSPVVIGDGSALHWFGLGPISVDPEHQRQGIGSQLMRAALQELQALGAAGCVLLGDPEYYRRFGFLPAAPLVLADVPPMYFQAVVFDGELPAGNVQYHAAFEATE